MSDKSLKCGGVPICSSAACSESQLSRFFCRRCTDTCVGVVGFLFPRPSSTQNDALAASIGGARLHIWFHPV